LPELRGAVLWANTGRARARQAARMDFFTRVSVLSIAHPQQGGRVVAS
jgi:hypothetical protein